MPVGLPTPDALLNREVGGFTLDTQVIEASGFRFAQGSLSALATQLPPWMRLVVSHIVFEESADHWAANIKTAWDQISSGHQNLRRHMLHALDAAMPDKQVFVGSAVNSFRLEFDAYIDRFHGVRLELNAADVLRESVSRYFRQQAPFGDGRNKKHEFPDAIALLELEDYARNDRASLIAVSRDAGWRNFAAASDWVYCVETVDELAVLFQSSSPDALLVSARVAQLVEDDHSVRRFVTTAISRDLPGMLWWVRPIQRYGRAMTGSVRQVSVGEFEFSGERPRVWMTDPTSCAAVLNVQVAVEAGVELEIEKNEFLPAEERHFLEHITQTVEVRLIMQLRGELVKAGSKLIVSVDVAQDNYRVDVSKFEKRLNPWFKLPNPASLLNWDGMDDDIPF